MIATRCNCVYPQTCEHCASSRICERLDVMIAQFQRLSDLSERSNGYDNLPLTRRVLSPVAATPYNLPFFEMGAVLTWGVLATDATNVDVQVYMQHSSIVLPNNRQFFAEFQGSATTFTIPSGNVTIPANGTIGFIFNAITGGTYASLSLSYNRSEQTGIEWMRSQRAGRIG